MSKRRKTDGGETTVLTLQEITDLVATALTRNGLNADSAAAIAEVSGPVAILPRFKTTPNMAEHHRG